MSYGFSLPPDGDGGVALADLEAAFATASERVKVERGLEPALEQQLHRALTCIKAAVQGDPEELELPFGPVIRATVSGHVGNGKPGNSPSWLSFGVTAWQNGQAEEPIEPSIPPV